MNSSTRRSSTLSAAVTVLGLMAGACVSAGDPGIQVDAKSAELVFGVEELDEATAADESAQIEYLDEVAPITIEVASRAPQRARAAAPPPLQFQGIDVPLFLDDERPPRPTVCYPEIRSAGSDQALAAFVNGRRPEAGTYLWNGARTRGPAASPTSVEALGGELRLLRNIKELGRQTPQSPEDSFGYEVVQAAGDYKPGQRQFLVSTYVVNPRPPVDSVRVPSQVEQAARPPQGRPPDSGLMLTRTQLVDVNGQPFPDRPAFEPLVGVFLLPLPVSPGETFNSTAVDPRSGKVVRVQGTVLRETRLNACGEAVDGYEVQAGVNITTSAGTSGYVSRYVVAPQLGALVLRESVETLPAPPTRAPQGGTGAQKTQRLCGTTTSSTSSTSSTSTTTTTTNPNAPSTTTTTIDSSGQCRLPVDTQGQEVPSQRVPAQRTPEDPIVPGGEGEREETAFNIGFLRPDPDLLPLSEFP